LSFKIRVFLAGTGPALPAIYCEFSHGKRPGLGGCQHGESIGFRRIPVKHLPRRQFFHGKNSWLDKSQRDVCAGLEKILVIQTGGGI